MKRVSPMLTTRRSALVAIPGLLLLPKIGWADRKPISDRMTLGFSTYGMKTLTLERALETIVEIGFESVEICVRPEWDSAPSRMSKDRRATLRKWFDQSGLKLTALMEHLPPGPTDADHKQQLERLRGVFELANDLGGTHPPLMQTVLGDGEWESKKLFLRDRVGDWMRLSEQHGVVTCIKPHRGGSMSRPSEAVWMIKQLGDSRWLRFVYDFSHYVFRDIALTESLKESLPYISHVAVKDTVQKDGKVAFELPGAAGTIDYATLFSVLRAGGYRGDISCEVSGMVSNQPNYEPIAAAKTCYRNVLPIFQRAVTEQA